MRICFWATTFQSHPLALACHLAAAPGFDVLVGLQHPEAFRAAPVAQLLRPRFELCDRDSDAGRDRMQRFDADLMVVDNHLPSCTLAPRVMVLWHGFGWRQNDLAGMRRALRRHVGRVTRPNTQFRWQAFGDWDRRYRAQRCRIAADNVVVFGSAYSDLLLPGSPARQRFDRQAVAADYSVDVVNRRTILVAPTWHYGSFLGHWGDEASLLGRLCTWADEREANVVVRLHDRFRYEPEYVDALAALSASHANLQCKYKDLTPDTLIDLLLADVVVSNYSSILADAYIAGVPTVSIWPVPNESRWTLRSLRRGRIRERRTRNPKRLWKLPLTDSGGPIARDFDELLAGIEHGLTEPASFTAGASAWLGRYIHQPDGSTCARIAACVDEWAGAGGAVR